MKIRNRTRVNISILLALSLILSIHTVILAEEIPAGISAEDSGSLDGSSAYGISVDLLPGKKYIPPEQMKTISENWDFISENLVRYTCSRLEEGGYTFLLFNNPAIVYPGKKGEKNIDFREHFHVIYADPHLSKTISDDDIDKLMLSANTCDVFQYPVRPDAGIANCALELSLVYAEVKSVKLKNSGSVTVDLQGNGLVPGNKCAYINKIIINAPDKKAQKALNKALKKHIKKIKNEKKDCISANGCRAGGTYGKDEDMFPLVLGIYPVYMGTDLEGNIDIDTICWNLFDSVSRDIIPIEGDDECYYEVNKYGKAYIDTKDSDFNGFFHPAFINYLDPTPDPAMRPMNIFYNTKTKYKNEKIQQIKFEGQYYGQHTLKPGKGSKALGLVNGGEDIFIDYHMPLTETMTEDFLDMEFIFAEANGNYFGTIYIDKDYMTPFTLLR